MNPSDRRYCEDLVKYAPNGAGQFAAKYLTEHPADEDEPITAEWLESEGIYGVIDVGSAKFQLAVFQSGVGICHLEDGSVCDELDLPHIKTRGQIRSLIRLLKGGE